MSIIDEEMYWLDLERFENEGGALSDGPHFRTHPVIQVEEGSIPSEEEKWENRSAVSLGSWR